MTKKDRLFEMMGKLNPSFKPKLNEDMRGDLHGSLHAADTDKEFEEPKKFPSGKFNQIKEPEQTDDNTIDVELSEISQELANRASREATLKSIETYIEEPYDDAAHQKALRQSKTFQDYKSPDEKKGTEPEINEVGGINRKYTHFAVLKSNNMIVNGWDYKGYEQEELNQEKKHYFFTDIGDMGINPRDVKIITTKKLIGMGIDPFNTQYWNKDAEPYTM